MSSAGCLNQTKRCLLTKLLCVSGPDGLCDTSVVSSGDELPLPHASERQVGLFFPCFSVVITYDSLAKNTSFKQ